MPDAPATRIRSRRWWSALVPLVLAVLLLAGCSAVAADEPTRTGDSEGYVGAEPSVTIVPPAEREPAPVIEGLVLGGEGRQLSTAELAGSVVVLNVWGSWCGPCRAEAPELQQASEQTAKVARFVGLNTRDYDQAPAVAFNRAHQITYPSIWDPTGAILVSLSDTLPPKAIPSTMIIDRQGRMAARVVGPVTSSTLVDLITDVADGK